MKHGETDYEAVYADVLKKLEDETKQQQATIARLRGALQLADDVIHDYIRLSDVATKTWTDYIKARDAALREAGEA